MRNYFLIAGLFFAIGIMPFTSTAQHLTISSSGETGTIGTNWSIIGNVLYVGSSGSASINTSVISNHLQNTGDLTINLPGQPTVGRNIYINNTIAYTGSSARTLTFQSGNDIVFANAVGITSATASLNIVLRTATTTGSPDNGSVTMDGINLDTKGGHIWVGGGATTATWNGLSVGNSSARTYFDDVAGVSVVGSTIASGGGKIYVSALSWNSSDDDGVNYGINIQNTNISSGTGDIYINADIYGRYTNGIGLRVTGNTTITSTSGPIYVRGYGLDAATNGNSWRQAALIQGSAQIKSVSGSITVVGDAAFSATVNDKEGLVVSDGAAICSQTGNITLRGTNSLESSGQFCNSIRFAAADLTNSIRIGFDGTNAYSGNITIEGNSIYQRFTHLGAGSIAVQTTGTLTIQPTGNSFSYMRAANSDPLTYDDDWNFGTNLGAFVYGKTTNTTALTYSNALTTSGPITLYAGSISQNAAFSTTSATGHIRLQSTADIAQAAALTSQGGSIVLWSDTDGTSGGRIGITANMSTNGGHVYVGGGSASETLNGMTVPSGYATSSTSTLSGISVAGSTINSSGGNIRMKGLNNSINGTNTGIIVSNNSTISSGAGSLSLYGQRTGDPNTSAGLFLGTEISSSTATGNVTISSTTGDIYLEGTTAGVNNTHSWCHGFAIVEYGGDDVSITSTTGNISMFGDASTAATYAGEAVGFVIQAGTTTSLTNIATDGGSILINGKSSNTGFNYGSSYRSANATANISIGDNNTGNLTLQFGSLSTNAYTNSIALNSSGAYVIEGNNGASFASTIDFSNSYTLGSLGTSFRIGSTTNNQNVWMKPAVTVSGPITAYANEFILYNNLTSTSASDIGIYAKTHFWTYDVRQTLQTAGGNIYLYADADANGSGQLELDYLTFNPGSGNTIIRGETFNFAIGAAGPYLNGTGSITIEPSDAAFGQTVQTMWFTFDQDNNGMGGLNLGKSGNTAQISFDGTNITAGGPVNIYGNNIVMSAALTANGSDVSLYANTAVTQVLPIIAAGLSLNGTGTFTLTNTSNNFTTLAGGATSSLLGATQIVDASGGLTIGTVGSNTGLKGSSTLRVETLAGDLTLAGSISTTSTSTDALILTSGKNTAIGVATGGDIIVSGSPTITMGTGAIAKLFSGNDATSTGLNTLVGGTANARYNYDETSTTFNPTLSANNKYAIYRTAVGYGDLTIVASGGDAEGTTWNYVNGVIKTLSGSANVLNTVVQTKLNTANLSIEANKIIFSANVTGTTSNSLSLLAKTHIVNTNATTITTQGGNVLFATNVDDATDGETIINGYTQLRYGITINTNGGDITFGGGNSSGSDYALGSSDEAYTEGIRFDGVIALNSNGGNIALRGKSYARSVQWGYGASGVGFYFFSAATGTINSGTGTITIDGYSQTNTSSYSAGFYSMHNLTISSANTTSDAIRLLCKATGASGEAWGIETEGIFSVLATGIGGGITVNTSQQLVNNYDAVFRSETNFLALSGPINFKTGQLSGASNGYLYLNGHMYLGSKSGSAVTSSSSNITLQMDRVAYDNFAIPKIGTSGSLTIQPNSTSFGMDIYSSYFNFNQNGQTMTNFTFGKIANAGNLYLNSAFTVAGPISAYGGYVEVSNTITSSGTGDILLKGITNSGGCVNVYGGITKTSGTGTLLMQGHGRVISSGTISASGTGVLNLVMWSDYDGDNVGGGSTLNGGSVSTNGGHVWMGGSNSNGGSYTWNGLTVGDGPSTGAAGSNCHAIDLFAPITTSGGDVLLWASNNGGCGTSGIVSDVNRHINAGAGDITLIAYQTAGAIELSSTGLISLLPHAGSYPSALTISGTLTAGNFSINTSLYNGLKINNMANSGLIVGNYSVHLSGGTAVTQGNSSNVTVSSALTTKSLEIYGGAIALNENITTTGTSADVLIKAISTINLAASKVITTNAGDVNLWADSDDNSAGYVQLFANTAINSNGGDINLGGGADLATDYAFGTTAETCSEATGTQYISGIHLRQNASLNSNGGAISLRGQNANTANAAMSFGISLRGVSMNSGTGKIAINGIANGSGSVNAQGVASWGTLTLRSANTTSDAISITGNALSSTGSSSLGVNTVALFEATGVGGGITITGKSGVASTNASVNIGGNILAASGPITISGENMSGVVDNIMIGSTTVIGKKSGTNVTTSSSNVILEGNTITTPGSVLVDCSGTLTVRPFGNSFSSAITWPMPNVSLASSITGLTIGKPTNTANVTFINATTINGPITIYGGTLALNENLTSSAGSTISLYGNILNFASGKTVTSSGLLIVAPQNSAGSIGMGGATGTLQLPASYFSTNFTDGFSLIQIGTNNHSSAIASNAFNLRDNMALYTTGSVTLGGKPVLGANNLTLGSAISSIISGATNYFQTNGTGKVFRNIPNGSNLILPIGRAFYNPVTIKNNTGTADDFSALVLDSVFLNGTTGPLITTPHVKATWDISKSNANNGSGIDFEFGWDLTQEIGSFTSYKLNHFESTWSFAAGTSQSTNGTATKTMVHTDYTGTFSPFAISEGTFALPVELISFNANCISNVVKLTWETASEQNSSEFIVEGSENGILWNKLGDLPASGNSVSLITYEFNVASDISRTMNYYRLTQIDIDGNATQYGAISKNCNSSNQFDVIAMPNPTDGAFTLNIYSDRSQEILIQLTNSDGKIISSELRENSAGSSNHYMNLEGIAAGIYTLQVYHLNGVLNKKIIIQ